MKTITALLFVAVAIALFSSTEAAAKKRALALQRCPESSTAEECEAFAKSQSEKYRYCHTYDVHNNMITWISCGAVSCGGDLEVVPEDLTKPHPECCKTCKPKN